MAKYVARTRVLGELTAVKGFRIHTRQPFAAIFGAQKVVPNNPQSHRQTMCHFPRYLGKPLQEIWFERSCTQKAL